MTRGFMNETIDHLTVAYNEKYISEELYSSIKDKINVNIKVLNGYMSYLRKLNKNKS